MTYEGGEAEQGYADRRSHVDDLPWQSFGAQVDPTETDQTDAQHTERGQRPIEAELPRKQSEQQARKQLKNERLFADIHTTAATFASQCEPTEHRNEIQETEAQAAVSASRARRDDRCATRHTIDDHGEE